MVCHGFTLIYFFSSGACPDRPGWVLVSMQESKEFQVSNLLSLLSYSIRHLLTGGRTKTEMRNKNHVDRLLTSLADCIPRWG
jgi:hypothetical protein